MTELHDLACVVHLHSVHSDGTGTVAEIAAAAAEAGVDAVLLTDHDTLAAQEYGEQRRYGSVLVCVGEEVSPSGGHHYLAFDLSEPIDHADLSPAEIVRAVAAAGAIGFLAHPFSRGSQRFRRLGKPMPWRDLEAAGEFTGLELWSWVTDTVERLPSLRAVLRFIARPERVVDHPPRENLSAWDALTAGRRVVAIGGLDAHQVGIRVGGRVPLRLMAYRRSFAQLRTHVLSDVAPGTDEDAERRAIYAALAQGRCYLALDALAPARGFRYWAELPDGARLEQGAETAHRAGITLRARLPRRARLTLIRDGEALRRLESDELEHEAERRGVYRLEAELDAYGATRTWILSNPLYLRADGR